MQLVSMPRQILSCLIHLIEFDCHLGYVFLTRKMWGEILSIITLVVLRKHQVLFGRPFRYSYSLSDIKPLISMFILISP